MKNLLLLLAKISLIASLVVLGVFLVAIMIGSMTHADSAANPQERKLSGRALTLCARARRFTSSDA